MGSCYGDRIISWKGNCTIDTDENISPVENPIFEILTKNTPLQTLCMNCNETESLSTCPVQQTKVQMHEDLKIGQRPWN